VVYDKIAMFIDWENGYAWNDATVGTPPTTERTYYIDDVTFVGQVPPPPATFTTLDFSGSGYQFNAFEGTAANVITEPSVQGSSNKVLRYVESATAKTYAGVSIGLDSAFSVDPIAFDVAAGETVMTARVWVDTAYGVGQVVRMQVADTAGSNDAHYVEAQATITQSGWNTLVFDFSEPVERYVAASNGPAVTALSSNVVYDKIAMFIDWENGYAWNDATVGTPPTTERTYYIDDVTFVGQVPPPPAPTTAAPEPTNNSADVVSLFSDIYENSPVDTWSPSWDQADVADVNVAGNAAKQYSNLGYSIIEFSSEMIDASNMTHLHLDVWKENPDTAFKIKLVDFGANGVWEGTNSDNVEAELSFNSAGKPSIEGNQWVGLDIPLSDFTGLTSRESLAQLIISGGGAGDTVWLDNIYLYNSAVI
jgi:hypothetical protein